MIEYVFLLSVSPGSSRPPRPLRLSSYFAAPSFYTFSPSPASSFVFPSLASSFTFAFPTALRSLRFVWSVATLRHRYHPESPTPCCVALPPAARPRTDLLPAFYSDPRLPTRLFWDLRRPRAPSAGRTHNTRPKLARIGFGLVF